MDTFTDALRRALDVEHLLTRGLQVGLGLILLLVSWWLASLTRRLVRKALARVSTTGHVDVLLSRTAGIAVFAIGALVSLSVMGVRVSALVTSLGLVGAAIGLALRDVLANTVAGVLLMLQRPFSIGDSIVVAGTDGVVRDIRIRDTLIEAGDGRLVFLPNMTVFTSAITNASINPRRRVEVRLNVPVSVDLARASALMTDTLAGVPGAMREPEPEAQLLSAGAATVRLAGRVWVDLAEVPAGVAQHEAIARVTAAFIEAGMLDGRSEVEPTDDDAVTGPLPDARPAPAQE